ncbi:meiosis-specific with OB domain-containing protein-like [Elysia marginata]|uniref:Meiosis-specific with OB domain-containing protein-like n=1 Tax=Elysia marginata TaxID=1093978 RepID=A0AAV4G7Y6_9GAST|nr:meiosis-specific with OB domain-containing protein-like [Elysia marginata]
MAWLGRFDDFKIAPPTKTTGLGDFDKTFGCGGRTTAQNQRAQMLKSSNQAGYINICDISSSVNHVSIIGVIIGKDGPKSVVSKRGTGSERHLVSFTIRDSDVAFINLTCWGGEQYIKMIACELNIGDVVDVRDAQVQTKSNNPADEKFRPWTPSPCQLITGENQGTVFPYSGLDIGDYSYLMQIPTRPANDFYTLEDIQTNGMSLQGEHIHILAVVKQVKELYFSGYFF